MVKLTPTPEVKLFLDLLSQDVHPTLAARQSGIRVPEATLIRKLAGLPVRKHPKDIRDRVKMLREAGLTHVKIAAVLDISASYVNQILNLKK